MVSICLPGDLDVIYIEQLASPGTFVILMVITVGYGTTLRPKKREHVKVKMFERMLDNDQQIEI